MQMHLSFVLSRFMLCADCQLCRQVILIQCRPSIVLYGIVLSLVGNVGSNYQIELCMSFAYVCLCYILVPKLQAKVSLNLTFPKLMCGLTKNEEQAQASQTHSQGEVSGVHVVGGGRSSSISNKISFVTYIPFSTVNFYSKDFSLKALTVQTRLN